AVAPGGLRALDYSFVSKPPPTNAAGLALASGSQGKGRWRRQMLLHPTNTLGEEYGDGSTGPVFGSDARWFDAWALNSRREGSLFLASGGGPGGGVGVRRLFVDRTHRGSYVWQAHVGADSADRPVVAWDRETLAMAMASDKHGHLRAVQPLR